MKFFSFTYFSDTLRYFFAKTGKIWDQIFFFGKSKSKNDLYYKYNQHRNSKSLKQICFAPQKSMYFGITGQVIACCQNTSHLFGKFPSNSISEIWNGENIMQLRNSLKKNDLSLGCFFCKYTIESGNYDIVQALRYDEIPHAQKYPTMLEFALDNRCNLKCIMCSEEYSTCFHPEFDSKKDRNTYNDDFVKQLEEFIPHLVHTSFYGGEPFLSTIYFEIWERMIDINPGCFISVQTNATVLNERVKKIIQKGNFIISISIDSFNKITYEKIRVNADFEHAMANLDYFLQYASKKKYTPGISVCPMIQNWKELPEIVIKCNELNATVYFNTVWLPAECSLYYLTIRELKTIYDKFSDIQLPENSDIERKNKYRFECFLLQLKKWERDKLAEEAIWSEHNIKKNEWQSVALTELLVILNRKIELQLLGNKNIHKDEIVHLIDKLSIVLKKFEDNVSYREALLRLIEIPADFLTYEILYKDGDTLLEQINKFISQVKR